ncbi:alpha-tocopherol transfer protein-like isoform X2 [Anthonomus grandis grandis]|nr:alpha-tocopherol transfer protein-like isoform X2 [Anthonomus grandis grandis]XP_050309790.1 alpha-tocopherol transfer protein-like isoform X2 [Anthonomus grandis grandis]
MDRPKPKETADNSNEDSNKYADIVLKIDIKEPEPDSPLMSWAERHINENPDTKLQLVEELRNMIFEKGECEPYRTDDEFLLRFLRARHFIVRMAHRLFVNYHTYRESNPNFFFNIDYGRMLEVVEADIFNVPPYLDEHGRRMLFWKIGNWNPTQFTTDQLFQTIIFLIQASTLEPKHQILGGVCIMDVENLGSNQVWYLSPSITKHMISVAYSSLPHRIEALHIVNVSKVFDYAFAMLKPLLSDLMKDRIFIHQNLESLHQHVSPKCLPKKYGGIHKDTYSFTDYLSVVRANEEFIDEMESFGYEGSREFIEKL